MKRTYEKTSHEMYTYEENGLITAFDKVSGKNTYTRENIDNGWTSTVINTSNNEIIKTTSLNNKDGLGLNDVALETVISDIDIEKIVSICTKNKDMKTLCRKEFDEGGEKIYSIRNYNLRYIPCDNKKLIEKKIYVKGHMFESSLLNYIRDKCSAYKAILSFIDNILNEYFEHEYVLDTYQLFDISDVNIINDDQLEGLCVPENCIMNFKLDNKFKDTSNEVLNEYHDVSFSRSSSISVPDDILINASIKNNILEIKKFTDKLISVVTIVCDHKMIPYKIIRENYKGTPTITEFNIGFSNETDNEIVITRSTNGVLDVKQFISVDTAELYSADNKYSYLIEKKEFGDFIAAPKTESGVLKSFVIVNKTRNIPDFVITDNKIIVNKFNGEKNNCCSYFSQFTDGELAFLPNMIFE